MKLGASYWMFEGGLEATLPVRDAMEQAKKVGYDSIELCIASTGVLTHKTTRAQCEDIVAMSHDIGIEISSLASGESWGCSPTSDDPAVREKIADFTKKALQVAAWFDTDAYLLVPGAVDVFFLPEGDVVAYDVCYDRARAFVAGLVDTAKETGVTICLENVWNKFLLSPLETRDFIDGFSSPFVGSYFDIGNVLLFGYPDQWIRILGERIKRVHVKDFDKRIGTAEGFVDLLEGSVQFKDVTQALAEVGYDGYVTAEMLPFQPGRPEKTIEAMRRIFG